MSVEIKDVKLLLPAIITYEKDNGEEESVFIYIDQINKDCVIPDSGSLNVNEFKEAFAKYYVTKNPVYKNPGLPKDILKGINPEDFTKGII